MKEEILAPGPKPSPGPGPNHPDRVRDPVPNFRCSFFILLVFSKFWVPTMVPGICEYFFTIIKIVSICLGVRLSVALCWVHSCVWDQNMVLWSWYLFFGPLNVFQKLKISSKIKFDEKKKVFRIVKHHIFNLVPQKLVERSVCDPKSAETYFWAPGDHFS